MLYLSNELSIDKSSLNGPTSPILAFRAHGRTAVVILALPRSKTGPTADVPRSRIGLDSVLISIEIIVAAPLRTRPRRPWWRPWLPAVHLRQRSNAARAQ